MNKYHFQNNIIKSCILININSKLLLIYFIPDLFFKIFVSFIDFFYSFFFLFFIASFKFIFFILFFIFYIFKFIRVISSDKSIKKQCYLPYLCFPFVYGVSDDITRINLKIENSETRLDYK